MRTTFNVQFFRKKNAEKKDGTAPVIARVTVNGQRVHFSTKQSIGAEQWSVEQNKAKGRTAKDRAFNSILDEIKTTLHTTYHELNRKEAVVTAEKVKNAFLGIGQEKLFLIELFDDCNKILNKQIGINKSKATYQKAEICKKHLTNYIQAEYNLSDIDLREVNHSFIVGFETYLLTVNKCNHNTAAKFIQKFRSIVLVAINNGQLQRDPFANYKIRLKKVDRGYLTKEELQRIIKKEIKNERLERIRDIFVFSCYTGLAYIDIKNLTTDHITQGFDDKLWIKTKRQKTNVATIVPILDVALNIINKYKGLPNNVLLPLPSNQKTNAYLKEIATICDINKNLTFHLARHTFATTITLSNGVPIESVSKMLGHTNIKTTQIYARITNEKISSDMQNLAEKLETAI